MKVNYFISLEEDQKTYDLSMQHVQSSLVIFGCHKNTENDECQSSIFIP